jgi:hypothetical protein
MPETNLTRRPWCYALGRHLVTLADGRELRLMQSVAGYQAVIRLATGDADGDYLAATDENSPEGTWYPSPSEALGAACLLLLEENRAVEQMLEDAMDARKRS